MKTRTDLEFHIKFYIPKGWIGPIREFDFAPSISEEDFQLILKGQIPNTRQYDKWYMKAAIEDWLSENLTSPTE